MAEENKVKWVKLHMTEICPRSEVVGMLLNEAKNGDIQLGAMVETDESGVENFTDGSRFIMRQHIWMIEILDDQPLLNVEERPERYTGMGGLG